MCTLGPFLLAQLQIYLATVYTYNYFNLHNYYNNYVTVSAKTLHVNNFTYVISHIP